MHINRLLLLTNVLILTPKVGSKCCKPSLLVNYDWVLKIHISNKSNKQVMLGVTLGSELF